MTVFTLALAYLRDRLLNTVLNILLLALGAATIVVLLKFSVQMQERLTRDAEGIDLVVGAKGSPLQLILSGIYHVDVPTGNIPWEDAETIMASPMVAEALPLALGDSFRGFRLVGTVPAYARKYASDVAQGRLWNAPFEAVMGAEAAARLGIAPGQKFASAHGIAGDEDRLHVHEQKPFTVVGILPATGSVVDRLILTSIESIWTMHGIGTESHDDHDDSHEHEDHDNHADDHHESDSHGEDGHGEESHGEDGHGEENHPADQHTDIHHGLRSNEAENTVVSDGPAREVTVLLVRYATPLAALRLPQWIEDASALQAAVPAIETTRLLSLVGVGLDAVRGFAVLLMITAALGVFVALSSAMAQRRYDIAMMRTMGASRRAVFTQIVTEGMLLAGIGALAGLVIGHGAIGAAAALVPGLSDFGLTAMGLVPGEGWIIVGALVLGGLAALLPAIQAYRVDIAQTLAQAS